ncbi:MAG: hypothetical protein LBQ60_03525 [Bacteroidales bacterium]|jgi:hypothetical protein|nr:hypothetical protein [Bacteroidales bacterium]
MMINRILIFTGLVILSMGIAMLVHSSSLQIYTDKDEFRKNAYDPDRTKSFHKIRKEYLTPKIELEDYGITFVVTGAFILMISFIGIHRLRTPNKKWWIKVLGILAALLTSFGYARYIILEAYRGAYPLWGDSIAIPLALTPVILIILSGWVALNLIGIRGDFKTNVLIFPFRFNHLNYWYVIILLLTIMMTLSVIFYGDFWQVFPGFLWIYFYTSILLGRRQAKMEKIKMIVPSV